jgi:UDP-glucuronate 4-epimerase
MTTSGSSALLPASGRNRLRVLVTGVAGFIGSHVAEALLTRGAEVIGLDGFVNSYPRAHKEANLVALSTMPGFRFVEAELRTDPLDELTSGVDAVINEAAFPGLPRSWTELEAYVGCNLLGLARLVDACHTAGIQRFVQASTSSVYGVEAVGDETTPTRPVSPYGVSKLAAEHLLLAHVHEHGFPAVILRYFSIYGPRQRPDMAYHVFSRALLEGTPLPVYGDGRQSRSNTYVTDCVAGTLLALDRGKVGEAYNIGGGVEISLRDAIDLLAEAVGTQPQLDFQPARAGDQRRTIADTTKAREQLGYVPTVTPEEGLPLQVGWHRGRQ